MAPRNNHGRAGRTASRKNSAGPTQPNVVTRSSKITKSANKTRGTSSNRGAAKRTVSRRSSSTPGPERKLITYDVYSGTPVTDLEESRQVPRMTKSLSKCSELSLAFVEQAGLATDTDTNNIALNLMDHFLFSKENWLPALSYCKLHAACFLMASHLTEKENTAADVASALAPDSEFVQVMATLVGDEDAATTFADQLGVNVKEVQQSYALLYNRKEELKPLLGRYDDGIYTLPLPEILPRHSLSEEEELDLDRWCSNAS